MYFIYDEEYLDEEGDFDYLMSPCFESFEKASQYGILRALRDNKKIVTLISEEGSIITFYNPHLDEPKSQISKVSVGPFKKYLPNWIQKHYKKGQTKGKETPPDIPDICPEFDVD